MRKILQTFFFYAVIASCAIAADSPVKFDSEADRQRYDTLLEELRCLVCQNQSLSDSHADLAQDLRDQVYTMIISGKDNAAIADFMVARYGDFVLYKPPVKSTTWFLWFGPLLLLIGAAATVIIVTRGRANTTPPLSEEERQRLQSIIDSDPD
jgi:cytochrome c-type biogenesis protein CcmH